MKRLKIPVKKKRTNKENYGRYSFENNFKPRKYLRVIFYILVALLPVFLTFAYLKYASTTNQVLSFPLDDPWIHLNFARNLAEYFSFSYFKNEMVTAGTTSPLYTFILSILFLISNNEMMISYFLGVTFFVLASISFYKLCTYEFDKELIFALLCTGIFIIDKWVNLIALSGMETTMYLFLLILCAYFYKKRKAIPFAIILGLLMWTRPDAVAFIAAVIIDYILVKIYSKNEFRLVLFTSKQLKQIVFIFLGIVGIYFLMNFLLSGTLLPNTYEAKLTYYSPDLRSRTDFIRFEVWEYFKAGSYYVIMIGFLFSAGKFFYDLYKKSYNQNTLYILFALALVFIYWIKLPYAHRFGRYMMPIIPFFILAGTIGFRDMARIINKYTTNPLFAKSIFYILIGVTYFIGIKNYDETRETYAVYAKYVYENQVRSGIWINKNTPENAIVATNDVGAIGFYGKRKIVDAVGLVTPELIKKINDKDYAEFLSNYFKEKGVTHLAFSREWFRVSNQNSLFTSIPALPPETIEVFKFDPASTHILSREANSLLLNAQKLVNQKAAQQLIYVLDRVLELEPQCSYAYYLRAYAYSLLKDNASYENNMNKAISIFPEFKDAHYYLGIHYKDVGNLEGAKNHLSRTLELEPANVPAATALKVVTDSLMTRESLFRNRE